MAPSVLMLQVTGLDHIGLKVTDMDRSLHLYHDVLGLEILAAYSRRNVLNVPSPGAGGAIPYLSPSSSNVVGRIAPSRCTCRYALGSVRRLRRVDGNTSGLCRR